MQQLRPVTFHYKQEPNGPVQYGLIAEEVAKVYPDLVTRDAKGTIEGVRYEELTPLLLTALQHQQQEQVRQQQEIVALKARKSALTSGAGGAERGLGGSGRAVGGGGSHGDGGQSLRGNERTG